jgi:hypothetical protein
MDKSNTCQGLSRLLFGGSCFVFTLRSNCKDKQDVPAVNNKQTGQPLPSVAKDSSPDL